MASTKTAPPSRPLPPPPSPLMSPGRSRITTRTSASSSNTHDASKLGVPANPRASGRVPSQSSQAQSVPPLGPPPSLPLPDLPPFPSPVVQQAVNTPVRVVDATPLRPGFPRRISEHTIPASPTRNMRFGAESAVLTPHVARRTVSSASLGKRPSRPLSTASVWSVASANSHISAASEALGQSMAELDRDADAMGILLSSTSLRPDGSARPSLSRSLGSSSVKRHGSSQRPSLPSTHSAPVVLSLKGEPPSPHPLRQSSSSPLLTGTRKVSLRSLYPPPDSAGLPSPNEEEEREPGHDDYDIPATNPHTRSHTFEHGHISTARSSALSHARLSLASSSASSASGSGSISGTSLSYQSAGSTSSATTGQVRGRSRLVQKAGRVAAAEARAVEEGRTSPDVVDMLEATPRPARKKSNGSLTGSAATSRPSQSKERPRSKSRVRDSNGSANDTIGLRPLRGSAGNARSHISSSILSTLSDPVPLPHAPPPSSFVRSRHQLSEITRRATEDIVAMTVVSPTESSTGDDAWMTADCGEGIGSGSESESSIDLHTPLPHILVRDGMLSPTSTVVRSLSSDTTNLQSTKITKGSRVEKASHTEVRKRRHRDGKLLREGVGLTTGLGWSDSEDEDSPGPMRRRLSHMLLRRVGSTSSSLAASDAESAAVNATPSMATPLPQPLSPPTGERMQSLRKASSSTGAPTTLESRSDTSRSVLSTNPSLDAKVKALLAAYKKGTQARIVPTASSASSNSTGTARRPSLTSNYTSTSAAGAPRSASLPRSSILSLKTPGASEEDDGELAAAEAAYRHSKEISTSIRYAGSGASRGGKASRASSSIDSRDSIYSAASSGVTEFGTLASSTSAGHRTRSRAVSASNSSCSAPPPSAFSFPPAILSALGTSKYTTNTGASSGALSAASSPVSASTPSPSASTAPSSARQSLLADFHLTDEGDPASRIAKLSNASTTSVSSAAHSLAPSLFSISSVNSADTSCTSDGGGMIPSIPPVSHGDVVNIIPPTPTGIDEHTKVNMAPSLRARKQLSRRPSAASLSATNRQAEEMRYPPSERRNDSAKLRKPNTPYSPPPHSLPAPNDVLHNTQRVPPIPQSIPQFSSNRVRASTAPQRLPTLLS